MEYLIPIRCAEKCPAGKHCCFGEIYVESLGDKPIRERHKCQRPKITGKEFVETEITKPAA